ncbi:AcrR family transcriptional regulator [Nocardia sp. GAS34]
MLAPVVADDAETGLRARKRKRTQDAIVDCALRLFEEKGYDAVTIEEIAAAADVAPRTFYRYFPAKEDVILGNPDGRAASATALSQRRPGETDAEFITRAMLAGLTAGDPERTARSYRLIQSVPALQARMFRLMWGADHEPFVDALLDGVERTRDAELRARVIAHAVSDTLRIAVTWWLQGHQSGTLIDACNKAMSYLSEAVTI